MDTAQPATISPEQRRLPDRGTNKSRRAPLHWRPSRTPQDCIEDVGATLGLHQRLAHDYDVVILESMAHAYSHVKRELPSVIIVHLHLARKDGFHVLSMLTLDRETRSIPIVTITTA